RSAPVYREINLLDPAVRMVARVENLCSFHGALGDFCRGGAVHAYVSELFGEPAVLFMDKINCKLPRGSNGWRPHQDQDNEWDQYCPLFVTAAIALDPATRDNGCLRLARGEHLKSFTTGSARLLALAEMEAMRFEEVEMAPGDAVFFSSYTPHCSAPNLSDQPRRLLYLTYNRLSDGDHRLAHYEVKRRLFPPDVERDPAVPGLFHYHRRSM
ncbi:MAG TPA: phytanoyl-CoA dioxygenase family protein, partial [Myxococcales bacterium]|nr:phytanoyl-CoA dioxygenase family protein [Myxococcales bacterium]